VSKQKLQTTNKRENSNTKGYVSLFVPPCRFALAIERWLQVATAHISECSSISSLCSFRVHMPIVWAIHRKNEFEHHRNGNFYRHN